MLALPGTIASAEAQCLLALLPCCHIYYLYSCSPHVKHVQSPLSYFHVQHCFF